MNIWELLQELWKARPCFICQSRDNCGHREMEADKASLHVMLRRREPQAAAAAATQKNLQLVLPGMVSIAAAGVHHVH